MSCKVVICDDNKNIRMFLELMLQSHEGMSVVGMGENGKDAVSLCKKLKPDLLLIDMEMDSAYDGIDAIKNIREFDLNVKIIVLTIYNNNDYLGKSFANGADNFLLKDQSPVEIYETIENVLSGKSSFSQHVATGLKDFIVSHHKENSEHDLAYKEATRIYKMLTKTELEIVVLLHKGYTRNEIAQIKVVESGTVKTHITHILRKFHHKKTASFIEELDKIDFFAYLEEVSAEGDI